MNITKYNQHVALDDFRAELQKCDFCAVDQEMTGVDVREDPTQFGTSPDDVYRSKRVAVERYIAFQFGIALFTRQPDGSFEVRPYNFYLLNNEGEVNLNLSGISFLAEHKMDFQVWLTSGISYCTAEKEAELLNSLRLQAEDEEEQTMCHDILNKMDQWYTSNEVPSFSCEEKCGTHTAQLVRQNLEDMRDRYHVIFKYSGKPWLGEGITFSFERISDTEWEKHISLKDSEKSLRMEKLLGFRLYWKAIVESKKPIIGHNFFQDLMFMIHMHETQLPIKYAEFKKKSNELFPAIFDTKTMATALGASQFPQTHLGFVYRECRRRISNATDFQNKFRLPPGFYGYSDSYLKDSDKAHEAAYDAFMTGICFYYLCEMHEGKENAYKNVIAAFGSSYYMCMDQEDRLVDPNTFIFETSKWCFFEQVGGLLYTTIQTPVDEDLQNGNVDPRKPEYRVSGIGASNNKKFRLFCVVFKSEQSAENLREKINSVTDTSFSVKINKL